MGMAADRMSTHIAHYLTWEMAADRMTTHIAHYLTREWRPIA